MYLIYCWTPTSNHYLGEFSWPEARTVADEHQRGKPVDGLGYHRCAVVTRDMDTVYRAWERSRLA